MRHFISKNKKWILTAIVCFMIAVHFILAFTSARIKSPTIDEYTYISTGYLYVKTGDFRLDRTHPPLIRLLIGLPLQLLDIQQPILRMDEWDDPISYELGYIIGSDMLLLKRNNIQRILIFSRLPIMLLSCLLAWLLFYWGRELYGVMGGLTVLFLYCFSPNILAHARLATLDLGASFFIVLALFSVHRYIKSPSLLRLCLAGIALGAALVAKATALILLPVYLVALFWVLFRSVKSIYDFPVVQCIKRCLLLFVCVLITIFVVYGYPFKPFYYLDTLNNVFSKSLSSGKGGEIIPGMPHRHHAFYLLGDYSTDGWPYYYLVALVVKTPLAVFAALGLWMTFGRRRWRGATDALIVGVIIILHVLAAFNRVNIGLRHILPFYPLMFLYLGRVVELRSKRWLSVVLSGIAIWYASSCAAIYPDFLSYFNQVAGGPENGHELLDDSNIDWGQDLGRLVFIKDQYPGEDLYIAHQWLFLPTPFGYDARLLLKEQISSPPKGIVAVSKHWAVRNRISRRSPDYFDWLDKYEPIGEIGHSIWLFRFE